MQVEQLLETYFMNLDNTWNRLQTLAEYVDDTEDYIKFDVRFLWHGSDSMLIVLGSLPKRTSIERQSLASSTLCAINADRHQEEPVHRGVDLPRAGCEALPLFCMSHTL